MSINTYGPLFTSDINITPEIRKAANEASRFAKFALRLNSPVLTGALREAWEVTPEGRGLRITNGQYYAIYQEMGTKFFRGRRMVARSLPAIQDAFDTELSSALSRKLAGEVIGKITKTPAQYKTKPKGTQMSNYRYKSLTEGQAPAIKGFGRSFGEKK